MKNKSILFILLFIFTYTKAVGQTFVYTYNAQGGCTSRIIKGTQKRSPKVTQASLDANLLKVALSPSKYFQDQLSFSVAGLPSGRSLSYVMANVSGLVVSKGSLGNGSIILTTTAMPKGVYIIKVSGDNFEESYKLIKD